MLKNFGNTIRYLSECIVAVQDLTFTFNTPPRQIVHTPEEPSVSSPSCPPPPKKKSRLSLGRNSQDTGIVGGKVYQILRIWIITEQEPQHCISLNFLGFALSFQNNTNIQCCGSETIYSGSGSAASIEFSEFWIRIWIQAKVSDPCGSGSITLLIFIPICAIDDC